jgi:uncharacterized GH25 family protein
MRRTLLIAALLAMMVAATASAHDLFLKLDTYFLAPNSKATVRLFNGTFQKSDGLVARDRLQFISLRRPQSPGLADEGLTWRDEDKTTVMEIQTRESGTYLVGVSTKPREISLNAAEFNDYLAHDGIPDTLSQRRKNNEFSKEVRERYSKHVRAVFQVGDKVTDDYKHPLGYPVEIIPQQNPYALKAGDSLSVLCTLAGQPLVNQYVLASWDSGDGKTHQLNARSDRQGIVRFKLDAPGKWYVKFIHMTPLNEPNLNYESKWASLTFEIQGRK